jgi:hypothetical protein
MHHPQCIIYMYIQNYSKISMPLILKLVIFLVLYFPSTKFMYSYFSWKSFSLFHRVVQERIHLIIPSLTHPHDYSYDAIRILEFPLPCFTHPSRLRYPLLLHIPSTIHLAKDFTHKESANSLPEPTKVLHL